MHLWVRCCQQHRPSQAVVQSHQGNPSENRGRWWRDTCITTQDQAFADRKPKTSWIGEKLKHPSQNDTKSTTASCRQTAMELQHLPFYTQRGLSRRSHSALEQVTRRLGRKLVRRNNPLPCIFCPFLTPSVLSRQVLCVHVTSQRRVMRTLHKVIQTPFFGVLTDGVRGFETPFCGARHHFVERNHHFLSFWLCESVEAFDCLKVVNECWNFEKKGGSAEKKRSLRKIGWKKKFWKKKMVCQKISWAERKFGKGRKHRITEYRL